VLTEEQRESVRYASEWLGRSDDIGNQKHAERLRTLLATHSAGVRESVAQWQYRFFDGVKWVDWANCTELLVKHKDGRDDFQFRALFERAHPQPMTDAARDAEDAKPYRFIKSKMQVGAVQTQLPLYRTLHWIGYEDCSDVRNADEAIDAEIERLDREAGERCQAFSTTTPSTVRFSRPVAA